MNWLAGFTTPMLLIGMGAAAIPFVLHLLSSVKAQEVYFPTLRFLRRSMEKTARRRRIQHWLLLLLRALLMAFLAISAAEPISEATGGWLTGKNHASVIILDNSFSMAARSGGSTRFDLAQAEAVALLDGPDRPTLAAVMTTFGDEKGEKVLTAEIADLRDAVTRARVGFGQASVAQRVAQAITLLSSDPTAQKSIYLLSDMQKTSFEELAELKELAAAKDIHLLIVDTSGADKDRNVAVTDLEVVGRYVLNQTVAVRAKLYNSSTVARRFEAVLRIDGRGEVARQDGVLGPTGGKTITFENVRMERAGAIRGEVFVQADGEDLLALDDVRRFSLEVAGRVGVLVVAGPAEPETPLELGPAGMLTVALNPFDDIPGTVWSVAPRVVEADRFAAADLAGVDAVFFCNVPSFTAEQARAMFNFALAGGTVVIFLGPDTDAANYNQRLVAEGGPTPLMPVRLGEAVGQVGPTAEARRVDWVDTTHPYFAGLHEKMGDYLGIRVQRHFRLAPGARGGRTLLRLGRGPGDDEHDALLLVDRCGAGRVVLCTTTASRRWTNLPVTNLFLPAVVRISLHARRGAGRNNTVVAGRPAVIHPPSAQEAGAAFAAGSQIEVIPPRKPDRGEGPAAPPTAFEQTTRGLVATFEQTDQLGVYTWMSAGGGAVEGTGGEFVVNPHGPESLLEPADGRRLCQALADKGLKRVYVGGDIKDVTAAALADTKQANWWDVVLAAAIVLLVVEAVAANRRRRRQGDDDVIPAHLNPRLARHAGSARGDAGDSGAAA